MLRILPSVLFTLGAIVAQADCSPPVVNSGAIEPAFSSAFGNDVRGIDMIPTHGTPAYYGVATVLDGNEADLVAFTWNGPGTPVVTSLPDNGPGGWVRAHNTTNDEWTPSIYPVSSPTENRIIAFLRNGQVPAVGAAPTARLVEVTAQGLPVRFAAINGIPTTGRNLMGASLASRHVAYSTMQLAKVRSQPTLLWTRSCSRGNQDNQTSHVMRSPITITGPMFGQLGATSVVHSNNDNDAFFHSPQPLLDASGNARSLVFARYVFDGSDTASRMLFFSADPQTGIFHGTARLIDVPKARPTDPNPFYWQFAALNGTLVAPGNPALGDAERIDIVAASTEQPANSSQTVLVDSVAWVPFGTSPLPAAQAIVSVPGAYVPVPLSSFIPGAFGDVCFNPANPTVLIGTTFHNGRLDYSWQLPPGVDRSLLRVQVLAPGVEAGVAISNEARVH